MKVSPLFRLSVSSSVRSRATLNNRSSQVSPTGHPITTPSFYASPDSCPDTLLTHIFRSCTLESIPFLSQRISILRSAGAVLSSPTTTPLALIDSANHSASRLVNLLVTHIPDLNDTHPFHSKQVKFHKRAQILVADLWAAFNGTSYGAFDDIDTLTMFADYRVPQMLHTLGCLWYSPRLESRIKRKDELRSGEDVEIEIRGCSIWCVELIRREIGRRFGGEVEIEVADGDREKVKKKVKVNAVLIDYLLYDVAKEKELERGVEEGVLEDSADSKGMRLPHHRTRSIWY
jgi:Potential Queuosine, Q, salvage protein family